MRIRWAANFESRKNLRLGLGEVIAGLRRVLRERSEQLLMTGHLTPLESSSLGFVCLVVLGITLTLGLWPFHSPRNAVTWLKGSRGVNFGRHGTILSSGTLRSPRFDDATAGSIEIWAQPDHSHDSSTLLALYSPKEPIVVRLRQSLTDLEVESETTNDLGNTVKARFYVDDAFGLGLRQKKPVFIAATYGRQGTIVYLNGTPAKMAPRFKIPVAAFSGRLVVGDSPWQTNSFRGQIRGLAVYKSELNAKQVAGHFRTWTEDGWPDVIEAEYPIALYLFDEQAGHSVHSHVPHSADLYIPEIYTVADKVTLEPLWKEFSFSGSYWRAALKNVVGFIPMGFCLYAYLAFAHPRKGAMAAAVLGGTLVSLTIETFQAFLPMRDSGTTDLVTNTFGTYVGALCCRHAYVAFAKGGLSFDRLASPRARLQNHYQDQVEEVVGDQRIK